MFLVILLSGWHNVWWGQQKAQCGRHNAWCGRRNACEVWWVGQTQSVTPPHMAKNKFLLNEYLGIFMHFESIFFIFLNLENGLFQTHPPTKSWKFQIFFPFFWTLPLEFQGKMNQNTVSCQVSFLVLRKSFERLQS